jgi:hypothetical protein
MSGDSLSGWQRFRLTAAYSAVFGTMWLTWAIAVVLRHPAEWLYWLGAGLFLLPAVGSFSNAVQRLRDARRETEIHPSQGH